MPDSDPSPTPNRHGPFHLGHPEPHIPGHELSEIPSPAPRRIVLFAFALLGVGAAIVGFKLHHWAAGSVPPQVALPWIIPFALLLGSIAMMPFIHRHWWEHNYARVAIALGLIISIYYLFGFDQGAGRKAIAASLAEYISFIFLLGSLYVVSGGILIRVRAKATPMANVALLLLGAINANIFGTTGASMLLIRPYLNINRGHIRPYHVVFFIFIVSNLGGSLTPIGDPPLFLGFLQGVPFWWVFEHCNLIWVTSNGLLLLMFYFIDRRHAQAGVRQDTSDGLGPTVSVYGAVNLLFIALIVGGILLHEPINHAIHDTLGFELPVRELCMLLATVGSLLATPHRVHVENKFAYGPIKEVAFLFIGIFLTMTPALNYLYWQSSQSTLIQSPTQYYFATGVLSAFLDNAPTYLTFLETAIGQFGVPADGSRVGGLLVDPVGNQVLIAISMGAVLFGAATYIGNGPNFMVKAIADHSGVPMPSFFGYVFRYAIPILLPMLVLVWVMFIR